MSAPAAVHQWAPADEETLTALLAAVRAWTSLGGGALLDDVGAVLDDVTPAEDEVEEHAERLRGHLLRLIDVAVAAQAAEDDQAARLIVQARAVRAEDMPGEH